LALVVPAALQPHLRALDRQLISPQAKQFTPCLAVAAGAVITTLTKTDYLAAAVAALAVVPLRVEMAADHRLDKFFGLLIILWELFLGKDYIHPLFLLLAVKDIISLVLSL
jgi:hypothetical protein